MNLIETLPVKDQIERAIISIPGWTPVDQLLTLFTLAFSTTDMPGDVLELGSWCGRSAIALGMAVRLGGSGRVHCIDLFPEKSDWYKNHDGSYSLSVCIDENIYHAYTEQTVWAEPFARDISPVYERYTGTLDAFKEAVSINGLENQISWTKGDLEIFARNAQSDLRLRMAFVDGDHSYLAVTKDIKIIEKYLLPGGWICFDDAFSSYGGVDQAIKEHIISNREYDLKQQITRKLFVARKAL